MTAEIAILNSSGIALAADSAVTIGSQKVYNSANKLFTLSKHQPIGIMVYDSADLMSIPWEIIIKEYRAELDTNSFPTLSEYADHFWEFIRTNEHAIPEEKKINYVSIQADNYFGVYVYSELEKRIEEYIKNNDEVNIEKTLELLRTIIKENGESIEQIDNIEGYDSYEIGPIIENWSIYFLESMKICLGELFDLLTPEDIKNLNEQIARIFLKNNFLLRTTGVVIAGFGTSEMFPKIASYLVEGVFDNKVRKTFNAGKSNIQKDIFATTIIPFAQDEMVWTFISGIDPDINKFASTFLSHIFKKYPDSLQSEALGLEEEVLEQAKKKLAKDGEKLLEEFQTAILEFQQKNNSQPIIDMVNVLPKDELAAMAESLVNLTVFKRKVSKAIETVGGPIDVAVISKGDGFIWVKRKHYFEPELNQHFFSNYFQRGEKE